MSLSSTSPAWLGLLALCCLCYSSSSVLAIEVQSLSASSFDLTLANSAYAAVLFFDDSPTGQAMISNWENAAALLDSLHDDASMVQVDGHDPDLKELIDAYNIAVPSIRVFRRSVMGDYRGPSSSSSPSSSSGSGRSLAQEIADYIREDALPSVSILSTTDEIRQALASPASTAAAAATGEQGFVQPGQHKPKPSTTVIGFFSQRELEEDTGDGYSVSSWGQFQAAADSLRGHSTFLASSSAEIMASFRLSERDLPAVYLVGEDRDKITPFSGEILEQSLAEWVLRHSTPSTGELTLTTPAGELYATQFFSSRRLKFILFLPSRRGAEAEAILQEWTEVSELYKGTALFSFMIDGAVSDVAGYFELDVHSAVPIIVAHDPTQDSRFKSGPMKSLTKENLLSFVSGVMKGSVPRMLKSEPVPAKGMANGGIKTSVIQAVGSTILDIVSESDKDVLLQVTSPRCANCRKLAATYDILAKAVAGEPRIVIAKIDGVNNDLPLSWGVRTYPTILWFPAKDKPYASGGTPVPRSYWDAGTSLHDLMSFVQRKGSFEMSSLRVATNEQMGTLLGDEEKIRAQYDELDRIERRNEGRVVFENAALDYLNGEIVYDGKRWHVLAALLLFLYSLAISIMYAASSSRAGAGAGVSDVMRKKKEK